MKLNSLLRRWVFLVVLLLGLSSAQSVQPPVSAAGPHFLPQLDSRPPLWRTLVDPSGLAVPTAAVQGENLYLLFLSAAPGTNVTTSYTVQVNGHPNGVVTLRWDAH